jgi:ribonucleoside-diphosphate reductase alpha chain
MYTYQEAYSASVEYFSGNELSAKVFVDKYALRDNDGNFVEKTPDDMHHRLAKEFARIEKSKFKKPLSEEKIYSYLKNFSKIVLQGSPSYGIGNKYQTVSIGNCFVLPAPLDSLSGINYTDAQIAQITCRRGGIGWDISKLRPKNLPVSNAAKSTSGAVSFTHVFSNTIRQVAQQGRRGASLQSISVHHPDVLDFIRVKQDLTSVTGSNITVQYTDEFMNALLKNEEYEQRWPVDSDCPKISRMVKAREIWDEAMNAAWKFAEPGACFIDTVHRESTGYHHGLIEESSNPCGEQYLPAYASCRLILQNLLSFVVDAFTPAARINFDELRDSAYIMQRLGDDMVDLELECIDKILCKIKSDPEPQCIKQISIDLWENIKNTAIADRRTGCGITALGDMFAALGIKYASEESIEIADKVFSTIRDAAYESSVDMAEELGPFNGYLWDNDIKSTFIQRLNDSNPKLCNRMQKFGRRNSVLLTIAPAGSVSILTQTSSGIEPVFMLEYKRRKKTYSKEEGSFVDQSGDWWQEYVVYHEPFQKWKLLNDSEEMESPWLGSLANDIDWVAKTKLQGVIQSYIDNSISVTTNLPKDTKLEQINDIYINAWKYGNKGCTIYVDGSRSGVLVSNTEEKKGIKKNNAPDRPKELPCDVHHITVKGKPYFVLTGLFDGEPYEVFAGKNGFIPKDVKTGKIIRMKKSFYKAILDDEDKTEISPVTLGCDEHEEALTRMTSVALRHGADVQFIVEQLNKVEGDMTTYAKSIARALKKYVVDGTISSESCPECHEKLTFQEGCLSCKSCGYSKC